MMEAMVYRKDEEIPLTMAMCPNGGEILLNETDCPTSPPDASTLYPGMFYPHISDTELDMWTHWLPTTIVCKRGSQQFNGNVVNTLERLNAPPEVLEEYQWSRTMGLFDAYEVRTPERRDTRDPLLIGRCGEVRYRIALWGESMRPLKDIAQLVQNSLVLRRRIAKWRMWSLISGTLFGLGLGLWVGWQEGFEGAPIAAAVAYALLGLFVTFLPFLFYTPEMRQHNFLDRYRH